MTGVYEPKPFIPHAASHHQAFAHCEWFSTAATRRCMDRVSVPLWLAVLSDQLSVLALVGFYPTNKLMERRLILKRPKPLIRRSHPVLSRFSPGYSELQGRFLRVTHPFAANPLQYCYRWIIARLACLIHAASVRSEPESNSPLRKALFWFKQKHCLNLQDYIPQVPPEQRTTKPQGALAYCAIQFSKNVGPHGPKFNNTLDNKCLHPLFGRVPSNEGRRTIPANHW